MKKYELSGVFLSLALLTSTTFLARGNESANTSRSSIAEAAGQATPTKKPATPRPTTTTIPENTPRPTPRRYATMTSTPFNPEQALNDVVAAACDAVGQPVRICPTLTPAPPDYIQPGAPRSTATPRRTNRP